MERRLMHKPHVSSTSYIFCESISYNEERCKFHTIETSYNTILKIWQLCHEIADIQLFFFYMWLKVRPNVGTGVKSSNFATCRQYNKANLQSVNVVTINHHHRIRQNCRRLQKRGAT